MIDDSAPVYIPAPLPFHVKSGITNTKSKRQSGKTKGAGNERKQTSLADRSGTYSAVDSSNPATPLPFHVPLEFDLIEELSEERDRYTVSSQESGSWVSITNLPSSCLLSLNMIRERVRYSKPGFVCSVAACLHWGLDDIEKHENIKSMQGLRTRFEGGGLHGENKDLCHLILAWFDLFSFDVPSNDGPVSKKYSIHLPQYIASPLDRLSFSLGITKTTMAVLGVMRTLSMQEEINAQDKQEMTEMLDRFYDKMKYKSRGTLAILEVFGL